MGSESVTDPTGRGERVAPLTDQLRKRNASLGLSDENNDVVVRVFLLGVRFGQGGTIPKLDQDTGEWAWPRDMKPQA